MRSSKLAGAFHGTTGTLCTGFHHHSPPGMRPAARRYVPSWMEIWITVAIVTAGVVAFRWIVKRMPILHEHPEWRGVH